MHTPQIKQFSALGSQWLDTSLEHFKVNNILCPQTGLLNCELILRMVILTSMCTNSSLCSLTSEIHRVGTLFGYRNYCLSFDVVCVTAFHIKKGTNPSIIQGESAVSDLCFPCTLLNFYNEHSLPEEAMTQRKKEQLNCLFPWIKSQDTLQAGVGLKTDIAASKRLLV